MATYRSGTKNTYYAILTVTENTPTAAQIASNKTTLNWSLYLYSGNNNFSGYTIGHSVYINGVNVKYQNNSGNQTSMSSNSSKYIAGSSIEVEHDADGSKNVPVSFSIWTDNISYLPVSLSASGNFTCTTLPRVSDIGIDIDTVDADGKSQVIATATKKTDTFTDVLTVSLGDYSQEITSGTAFIIPMEWNNAISGTSAKAKVEVETFSGTTSIGTKSVDLTVTVPDSIKPSVASIDVIDTNTTIANVFPNTYLNKLSKLKFTINAVGAYGSTITGYSTTFNSKTYTGSSFTVNNLDAKSYEIKTTITDSRNRTASLTETITVIEYTPPIFEDIQIIRCDDSGNINEAPTASKITVSGIVSSVNDLNTKSVEVKIRNKTDVVYEEYMINPTDYTFTDDIIITGLAYPATYEYVVTLSDKLNSVSRIIVVGLPTISRYAGGRGVTFFDEASENAFIVGSNMSSYFTGDFLIEDVELEAMLQQLG